MIPWRGKSLSNSRMSSFVPVLAHLKINGTNEYFVNFDHIKEIKQ